MSVEEQAREMARQYIPHEGGFSMGGLLQNIIEYFEADVAQLRADRNAAQQRAEQAERERDEARAVIDRAIEILGSPVSGSTLINDLMLEDHANVSNLLTAFRKSYYIAPQAQPAPTVKADEPDIDAIDRNLDLLIAQQDTNHASLQLDYAISDMNDENNIDAVMHLSEAVGHIIRVLKRMTKGGAK